MYGGEVYKMFMLKHVLPHLKILDKHFGSRRWIKLVDW